MWPFTKRISLSSSRIFEGFTDCHSHILPGVDDGVKHIEESLDILSRYEEMGFKAVWFTPHIMEDIPNTTSDLRERFEALKAEYHGPLELHLGAENMIDNLFENRLAANDFLPMGPKLDHLLVETSYFTPPFGFHDTLEKVKAAGYFPVLAHPERYVYMGSEDYDRLKEMKILFQLNLFSLAGYYGSSVQHTAEALLKKGYYDYAGTDIHTVTMLDRWPLRPIVPKSLPEFRTL
ncbi:MAG: capsular biosynthesis protein [Bacteroidales bacterium]|nr:capsular biosynthesis protein [Bacteroidales bacterium]